MCMYTVRFSVRVDWAWFRKWPMFLRVGQTLLPSRLGKGNEFAREVADEKRYERG